METILATIIRPNQAIKLQARKECKDREGNKRVTGIFLISYPWSYERTMKYSSFNVCVCVYILSFPFFPLTGEEWMVKKVGAYLPGVFEEVVDIVDAVILTEKVSGSFVSSTSSGKW